MRIAKAVFIVLGLGSYCLAAQPPATTLNDIVGKIFSQEHAEMESLQQYSPLVEAYVQYLRPDKDLGTVPSGDKYFLGHAMLGKVVKLEPFANVSSSGLRDFLKMIYIDTDGFDREHYKLDYVRREFLGEVRCLVFDVTPQEKAGRGRFVGRLWVEDHDYRIVRFNGAFTASSRANRYFHFDSWRINAGKNEWLPAYIYSEQGDLHGAITEKLISKAQTRLWGYNLGQAREEEELSEISIDSSTPVDDRSNNSHDLSPLQAQRTWDRHAEDNVTDRMERLGLMSPPGEVDKVLETVVNNLEVTNNLNIQPEIRCRVLMTSTFESFTIGHMIVLSRGLIDVVPDEATLAAILAVELEHIALGHRIDAQYAFFDRLLFDDKEAFRHFGFSRTPTEEEEAQQKAIDLLKNSPYKDQLGTAQLFLQALQGRSSDIPNLISPHLGDRIFTDWMLSTGSGAPDKSALIVALPLGARIKVNPWSDELQLIKAQPVSSAVEREKMPFEVTPFLPYLTHTEEDSIGSQTAGAIAGRLAGEQ